MPKILIVCVTDETVEAEAYAAMVNQTYPSFSTLIHIAKPKQYYTNSANLIRQGFVNTYLNCSENRNAGRKLALASDAEYFLFVDSDTVIPTHTLSNLMLPKKDIVGGYYLINGNETKYVAGGFVQNAAKQNVFKHIVNPPPPGLTPVHMVGLGCALIKRNVLEELQFEDGLDLSVLMGEDVEKPMISTMGECMAFGYRAGLKKFNMFMDGSVICKHLMKPSHYSRIPTNASTSIV